MIHPTVIVTILTMLFPLLVPHTSIASNLFFFSNHLAKHTVNSDTGFSHLFPNLVNSDTGFYSWGGK